MPKNRAFAFILLAAVFIASAVVAFSYIFSPHDSLLFGNDAEPIMSGWQTSDGTSASLPGSVSSDGDAVIMYTLPDDIADGTVLVVKTNYLYITATSGGSELFSWTAENKTLFGESFGLSCYILHIPPSAAGQTLALHLISSDGGECRIYDISLGDELAASAMLIRQNLYTFTLFFILVSTFILFTLFMVFTRKSITGQNTEGTLFLSAFIALAAVWIISNNDITMLLTRSVAASYYCASLSFMLMSVPIILYIRRFLGRRGIALNIIAALTVINFGANLILLALGLIRLTQTLFITQLLHITSCVLIVVLCIWEYSQTKRRETYPVFIGVGLLCLFSLVAFVQYFVTDNPNSSGLFITGLVAFIVTLAIGAVRQSTIAIIRSKSFEKLTALIPSGICKLENFDTATILYANEFFYRMFGYTESEAKQVGFTNGDFTVFPEDLAPTKEKIKKHFAVRLDRFETEARHVKKDGEIIWVLSRYRLDPVKRGEVTAVMIDITERKRMVDQLRIREEEYRIATRHSNKMILRFDIKTKTCYRQPGAMPDFDLPQIIEDFPDVLMNSDLVAHDSVPAIRTLFDSVYNGETEGSIIVSMRDRDSEEYRWYHFDFTSIFDSEGNPAQAIISYYDITLQRQKELAFQRWQQSFNAKPKYATNYFEYNLTDDVFEHEEGEMLPPVPEDVPRKLSQMAEYIAGHHIYPDDINSWLEFMNRDRLLDRYANNHNAERSDFRRLSGQDALWTSLSVQLIPDPYSSDVKAYFLLEDIDDRKQTELHLQERSMRDSLTGLLNRGSFIEQCNDILRKSDPETQHALIMLDIDNFKTINDTLGHSTGDALLVNIAKKLKYALRTDDLCGRLGGDEFVICLKHMNLGKQLEARVNDLCSLVTDESIIGVGVSASFGIAGFPYDGLTFDELYKKADIALYSAKANGRGGFAVYDPQLSLDDIENAPTDRIAQ